MNLQLFENFEGYLEIQHENAVPYLFYLPEKGLSTMTDTDLAMISTPSYLAFLEAFELMPDPTVGAIAVRAFTCDRQVPASGVVLTTSRLGEEQQPAGVVRWYFEGTLPTTDRETTDASGLGGFIGLPPGVYALTAELPGTPPTNISRRSVYVRERWMTAGYLRPTPPTE